MFLIHSAPSERRFSVLGCGRSNPHYFACSAGRLAHNRDGALMSRKARTNLVSADCNQDIDSLALSGGAVAAAGSSTNVAARRLFLEVYTPRKMEAAVIAAVRPQMIASVLDVDFTTRDSDKAMAHAYFLFANWCIQARGGFDSTTDMTLDMFDAFRVGYLKHYGSSSESTHMATLKRIQRKRRIVKGRPRRTATQPLSQRQWMGLLKAASEAGGLATDARTLLVLSGGLGLSSGEIAKATGAWVHRSGHRTSITIVDKNLQTRELPIYGADADWLRTRAAANPSGKLFWPACKNRTNAVSGFVAKMTRAHSEFQGFTATQARHMWLLNLLTSAVPFHVVCAMSGIKSDSNLASDLIAFAPAVAIGDIRYHLEPSRTNLTEGTAA